MGSEVFKASHEEGPIDLGLHTRRLEQVRKRLVWILMAALVTALLVYPFIDRVIDFLERPLAGTGSSLAFYRPAEALVAKIKLTFFTSIFLTMPFTFYQLRKVVSPWFSYRASRYSALALVAAIFLFYLGAILCVIWILPISLQFLIGYGGDQLKPFLSVDRYFTLCAILTLAFGTMFELPLILLFLELVGLMNSAKLAKNRGYAILSIAIASALITPTPDAYTMLLLTLPVIVLFEVSIWLVWLMERRRENGRKISHSRMD